MRPSHLLEIKLYTGSAPARLVGLIACFAVAALCSLNMRSVAGTLPAHADPQQDVDNLQEEGDKCYWVGNYESALPIFKALVTKQKASSNLEKALLIHHLRDLGDCLCQMGKHEEALVSYRQVLEMQKEANVGKESPLEYAQAESDLAACYFYLGENSKAAALDRDALNLYDHTPHAARAESAQICLELAETYYALRQYSKAIAYYERAINTYNSTEGDFGEKLAVAYEGLGACNWRFKNYKASLEPFRKESEFVRTLYGDTDVHYAWALMSLSGSYQKIGDKATASKLYEKCVFIFRRFNYGRILNEAQEKGQDTPELRAEMIRCIYGKGYDESVLKADNGIVGKANLVMKCSPRTGSSVRKHGPWLLSINGKVDPPGWIWLDPTVPHHALVVCVHGLGLNGKSYDAFARQIAPRGFMTLAFDMRGFGTYVASKGKDEVDFAGCLDDLTAVLKLIKRDQIDCPIFLLGESMGGAIALQCAARHPELIDGLILSVPAGNRYKSRQTDLLVALHLVHGRNKPFAIGSKIIGQATNNSALKTAWQNDPFNRLMLTPKELIRFDEFMGQNRASAEKIKKTAVIFFQGYQDRLVKATGTFQLFKAMPTEDKDFVLSGTSEHLIFEEGQFSKEVANGVVGWMLGHIAETKPASVAAF